MKTIPLEQLDPRTSEWLREAGSHEEIVVTKQGKPFITIAAAPSASGKVVHFGDRVLLPKFKAAMGQLSGGADSTTIISEGRDRNLE